MFLPFFQMCSKDVYSYNEKTKKDEIAKKAEWNLSAYDFAKTLFMKSDFKDLGYYVGLLFDIIIVVTIIMIIASFNSNLELIKLLSIFKIFLLMISTLLLIINSFLTSISQIKYGYVLFVIDNLCILYFCRKHEVD